VGLAGRPRAKKQTYAGGHFFMTVDISGRFFKKKRRQKMLILGPSRRHQHGPGNGN
jgi:hypothetical protein